ncbi:uncharacterized protein [Asterias amurensis]|uniref:uncharacterized protein n=1 Tax=Asterias amurensis TaxID=7602 RepID=UPI003AB72D24
MAAKKKGLHASKQRSNSSPELQLQVTDIDSADKRLGTTVKTADWRKYGDDDSNASHSKGATKKSDGVNNSSGNIESASKAAKSPIVPGQEEAKPCKSCGKTSEIEPTLGPSVRPKVRNYRFKTRTRHGKSLAGNKQQQHNADANRIIMDIGDNSVTVNSSSSETEEPSSKQQKRQGIGRVATAFVARFRHKGRKRRSSNTDSVSSTGVKDVKLESPRPRSKSFSGRIMRKLGTKDKSSNCKDLPCRDFNTRRKGWPHAKSIQSCIGEVFTGKGTLKTKGKSSKAELDARQPRRYTPVINLEEFNPEDYPIESEDDIQRVLREQEIREGVDPPPGYQPFDHFLTKVETHAEAADTKATAPTEKNSPKECKEEEKPGPSAAAAVAEALLNTSPKAGYPVLAGSTHTTANIYDQYGSLTPEGTYIPRTVHTQIDYMHCLVPDQKSIMDSSFYWGKIDRFEADLLLENKPEGTFLLRDSAHDEFVFSVSFRRYGRTLHARIEQWKHKFSFDAHDPGVYASDTICGLLKHYKDPNFCMFFEPMLTTPLPRPNPPSLQELARATICSNTSYDGITHLALPRTLKEYSREYHYKQRVRMRRFEVPEMPVVVEPKIGVITKTCISR